MDLVSKPGTSIATSLAKSFTSNVIERWTRRRAERFFEEFQKRILDSKISGDNFTDQSKLMDDIIKSEKGSEVLFDAYRRVSLAKSKVIGPRIIGLMTAEICLENRAANLIEESMFAVAETMCDYELICVASTIDGWFKNAHKEIPKVKRSDLAYTTKNELTYILEHTVSDITFGDTKEIDLNIGYLDDIFGLGFNKFKSLGFLIERVSQSSFSFDEDSERHIDYSGKAQIMIKTISFPLEYRRIITLIKTMAEGVDI